MQITDVTVSTDQIVISLTFIVYLLLLFAIGWAAYTRTRDLGDFILGTIGWVTPSGHLSRPFPESAANGPHLILPDICAVGMVSLADAVRLKYI